MYARLGLPGTSIFSGPAPLNFCLNFYILLCFVMFKNSVLQMATILLEKEFTILWEHVLLEQSRNIQHSKCKNNDGIMLHLFKNVTVTYIL